MTDGLPSFPYHPDPIATGSIAPSAEACEACGQARGYVYVGPTYCVDEVEFICPWCIHDGSAAEQFEAEFTTVDGAPAEISPEVIEEIVCRTPGFAGWQQERWLFHCGDGAAYLGRAGWSEIEGHAEAVATILADGWPEEVLTDISQDGDLTGYLFECRHCRTRLAYVDAS